MSQLIVLQRLREAGIPRRPNTRAPRNKPDEDAQIIALYKGGMTCVEVAAEVGVSGALVYVILKRYGIKLRPAYPRGPRGEDHATI